MHAGRAPEARPAGSFSGARWREVEGARDAELARAATSARGLGAGLRRDAPPCAAAQAGERRRRGTRSWLARDAPVRAHRAGWTGERLERGREQVLRRRFQGLGEALQDR